MEYVKPTTTKHQNIRNNYKHHLPILPDFLYVTMVYIAYLFR